MDNLEQNMPTIHTTILKNRFNLHHTLAILSF